MAAQLLALGLVTVPVAGTPVALSTVLPAPTVTDANQNAHAVIFQAKPGNTGKIYIGTSVMNKTTLAGVVLILAVPTNNVIPSGSLSVAFGANAICLADFYLDADTGGEGAIVSAIIA